MCFLCHNALYSCNDEWRDDDASAPAYLGPALRRSPACDRARACSRWRSRSRIATYFIVRTGQSPQRLLTPPFVALLLVANWLPCVALIMLLGRRIAMSRAAQSDASAAGRLHVRLVALFSPDRDGPDRARGDLRLGDVPVRRRVLVFRTRVSRRVRTPRGAGARIVRAKSHRQAMRPARTSDHGQTTCRPTISADIVRARSPGLPLPTICAADVYPRSLYRMRAVPGRADGKIVSHCTRSNHSEPRTTDRLRAYRRRFSASCAIRQRRHRLAMPTYSGGHAGDRAPRTCFSTSAPRSTSTELSRQQLQRCRTASSPIIKTLQTRARVAAAPVQRRVVRRRAADRRASRCGSRSSSPTGWFARSANWSTPRGASPGAI